MIDYRFYFLLEELKKQSKCLDKQVACIITDNKGNILSLGINDVRSCGGCTKEGDKEDCAVIHAEAKAVINLSPLYRSNHTLRAYVSLYPCAECQKVLEGIVDDIIVYGDKHKEKVIKTPIHILPNLALKLPEINGEQKQLAVISGELAECITAIGDFFYRDHERGEGLDSLLDEIVDVKTQTSVLLAILQKEYSSSVYSDLGRMEQSKLDKVHHAIKSGRIKRGSRYSNSLQNKDL